MKALLLILSLAAFCVSSISRAQDSEQEQEATPAENAIQKASQQRSQETLEQLKNLQESLQLKLAERKDLRADLQRTSDDLKAPLESELAKLNSEIELLEKTFEQVAIGGVDLSVFGEQEKKFDWREELVLVVQPLIENVKNLTEKPRKIESLRRAIDERKSRVETSVTAIESIDTLLSQAKTKAVEAKLEEIRGDWANTRDDLQREIQLAQFQLESLEGTNTPWLEVAKESMRGFLTGRGLTLFLAVVASLLVWSLMAGVLWLIRKRGDDSKDRSTRVFNRLAAYAYRALTAILIAVAVMTVLYMRQDLLLLAIVSIVLVGLALAFKNLLPQYIAEGRLLLNIGAVRERERVVYRGIPWRVTSINMFSQFSNPKINGILRVPISELHDLISRPTLAKDWFPSSEEDWVINSDGELLQVVAQRVELVHLRDLDSTSRYVPTADYYAGAYRNLSAGETFRVAVRFGIDYAHQGLDTESVSNEFKNGIEKSFAATPYAECVDEVRVEFDSAGDSSLNYVMLTRFKSDAARYHNRIERRIQAACVAVCNEQGWGIPFPQLTVHRPSESEKS